MYVVLSGWAITHHGKPHTLNTQLYIVYIQGLILLRNWSHSCGGKAEETEPFEECGLDSCTFYLHGGQWTLGINVDKALMKRFTVLGNIRLAVSHRQGYSTKPHERSAVNVWCWTLSKSENKLIWPCSATTEALLAYRVRWSACFITQA